MTHIEEIEQELARCREECERLDETWKLTIEDRDECREKLAVAEDRIKKLCDQNHECRSSWQSCEDKLRVAKKDIERINDTLAASEARERELSQYLPPEWRQHRVDAFHWYWGCPVCGSKKKVGHSDDCIWTRLANDHAALDACVEGHVANLREKLAASEARERELRNFVKQLASTGGAGDLASKLMVAYAAEDLREEWFILTHDARIWLQEHKSDNAALDTYVKERTAECQEKLAAAEAVMGAQQEIRDEMMSKYQEQLAAAEAKQRNVADSMKKWMHYNPNVSRPLNQYIAELESDDTALNAALEQARLNTLEVVLNYVTAGHDGDMSRGYTGPEEEALVEVVNAITTKIEQERLRMAMEADQIVAKYESSGTEAGAKGDYREARDYRMVANGARTVLAEVLKPEVANDKP